MLRRRRAGVCSLAAAAAAASALALCGSAQAEVTPTAQATADDGAFLAYTPAPAQRAGMCLVDTGVSLNPDTESTVVYRGAIDGGTGDDVSPDLHGTIMAMMAAAPANDWGMVGTAPTAIQIVSIRILEPGETRFPFRDYASGITACLQLRERYDIRTINLSLGNSEIPSGESYEAVTNAIERANARGIAVIAAAGNDDGGPVEYPAAFPGVLGIARATRPAERLARSPTTGKISCGRQAVTSTARTQPAAHLRMTSGRAAARHPPSPPRHSLHCLPTTRL